jgi:hypothetical protein
MKDFETIDGLGMGGMGEDPAPDFEAEFNKGVALVDESRLAGAELVQYRQEQYDALRAEKDRLLAAKAPINEIMKITEDLQTAYTAIMDAKGAALDASKALSEAGFTTEQAAGKSVETWAREAAMTAYDQVIKQVGSGLTPQDKQLLLRQLIGGMVPEDVEKWNNELQPKLERLYGAPAGSSNISNVIGLDGKPFSVDQIASLTNGARNSLLNMVANTPNPEVPPMSSGGVTTPGLEAFRTTGAQVLKQTGTNSFIQLAMWGVALYFGWKFLTRKSQ